MRRQPPGQRLGRGLEALIPHAPPAETDLRQVPVAAIHPNPRQPRARLDPAALEELAQSIREHGVLQPIVVSHQPDGSYQLLAGERRWRSAQLAGLTSVPAVVKETTPQANLEIALVENIQRADLNALEEAHAYKQLLEEHGLTHDRLAQRLGKSRVAVTNTLRLLQLPSAVQTALSDGLLTEGHARAILIAEGEKARLRLFERVVGEGLSVRRTEELARRLNDEPADEPPEPTASRLDPDLQRLEDALRQALGTRVQVLRGRGGAGRLVIHFYSDEELQGLYEALNAR